MQKQTVFMVSAAKFLSAIKISPLQFAAAVILIGLVAVPLIVSIPDVYAQPMQGSTICAASFFAPLIAQVTSQSSTAPCLDEYRDCLAAEDFWGPFAGYGCTAEYTLCLLEKGVLKSGLSAPERQQVIDSVNRELQNEAQVAVQTAVTAIAQSVNMTAQNVNVTGNATSLTATNATTTNATTAVPSQLEQEAVPEEGAATALPLPTMPPTTEEPPAEEPPAEEPPAEVIIEE
jgi:hypothetical protein